MIFLFLALFTAQFSKAASFQFLYCRPIQEIGKKMIDCQDNWRLSEDASLCIDELELKVRNNAAKLETVLRAQIQDGDKQVGNLRDTKSTYSQTIQDLDQLLTQAQITLLEVQVYHANLLWPEDAEADFVSELGGFRKFLDLSSCFREHNRFFYKAENDVRKIIQELSVARKVSSDKGAQAAVSVDQLGAGKMADQQKPLVNSQEEKGLDLQGSNISGARSETSPTAPPVSSSKDDWLKDLYKDKLK